MENGALYISAMLARARRCTKIIARESHSLESEREKERTRELASTRGLRAEKEGETGSLVHERRRGKERERVNL